ncbi:MAG: thrombospondin type 3 repeat-containing protein, partial [Desulfobacteraceae bacterium]
MKTKKVISVFYVLMLAAFLAGCAAPGPKAPANHFTPVDLNPLLDCGDYEQKVDSFLVVMDASGTMYGADNGPRKIDLAKGVVSRMNQTIPDLSLTAGLRALGHNFSDGTRLLYGMTGYTKEGLEGAVGPVTGGGMTPLASAIKAAPGDLSAAPGDIALIVISDGLETDASSVEAARELKARFGERICIYTVTLGDDPAGVKLMNDVAKAGECGFSVKAHEIVSSDDMADFVRRVFLAEAAPGDSDGDGVPDHKDRCPNTPSGVEVDAYGCPLDADGDGVPDYKDKCPGTPSEVKVDDAGCPVDTDGDGVPDYKDKCPGTPAKAKVDDRGCWVVQDLNFETDKADIRPEDYPMLYEVITVLKANPGLRVEIQGHTDSR